RRRPRAGVDRQPAGQPEGCARVARSHRSDPAARTRNARRTVRPRPRHGTGGRRDRAVTEEISRVPVWPLVFPLFWGAAVFFALAMTRHIRVMAAAHASGSYPLREAPRRAWSVAVHVLAQVRMFRDVRAALMH